MDTKRMAEELAQIMAEIRQGNQEAREAMERIEALKR